MTEQQRSSPVVLNVLREILLSLPALAIIWLSFRKHGPWRWATELQLLLMDAYYPFWSFALCFFLVIGITIGLHFAMKRAGWEGRPIVQRMASQMASRFGEKARGVPPWLALPFLFGLLAFAIGLGLLLPLYLAGPRTEVRVADLEAGERPNSRWLVIEGRVLLEKAVAWGRANNPQRQAACMVSERWRAGEPISVVLFAPGKKPLPRTRDLTWVEGTASGVPLEVRSSFERQGLILAEDALYVHIGKTPENALVEVIIVLIGAGLIVLTLLVALVRWLIRRRTSQQPVTG